MLPFLLMLSPQAFARKAAAQAPLTVKVSQEQHDVLLACFFSQQGKLATMAIARADYKPLSSQPSVEISDDLGETWIDYQPETQIRKVVSRIHKDEALAAQKCGELGESQILALDDEHAEPWRQMIDDFGPAPVKSISTVLNIAPSTLSSWGQSKRAAVKKTGVRTSSKSARPAREATFFFFGR